MRDAYLEAFDTLPRSALHEMLDLACRVAKASRAIVWDGSVESVQEYMGHLAADTGI